MSVFFWVIHCILQYLSLCDRVGSLLYSNSHCKLVRVVKYCEKSKKNIQMIDLRKKTNETFKDKTKNILSIQGNLQNIHEFIAKASRAC